jgi:Sedlin, N-terminal conserved region
LYEWLIKGYMTDTKIKFILMISLQDLTIKDQEVKNVFAIDADIQEDSSGVG